MCKKIKQGDIVRFTLENIRTLKGLGFDHKLLEDCRKPHVVLTVDRYISPFQSNAKVILTVRLVTHKGQDIWECDEEQLEYFPFPIKVLRND